jgi:hypothetical protein
MDATEVWCVEHKVPMQVICDTDVCPRCYEESLFSDYDVVGGVEDLWHWWWRRLDLTGP